MHINQGLTLQDNLVSVSLRQHLEHPEPKCWMLVLCCQGKHFSFYIYSFYVLARESWLWCNSWVAKNSTHSSKTLLISTHSEMMQNCYLKALLCGLCVTQTSTSQYLAVPLQIIVSRSSRRHRQQPHVGGDGANNLALSPTLWTFGLRRLCNLRK